MQYKSEILIQKTIDEEGHDPLQLKPKSNKYIWVSCRVCGEPNRVKRSKFLDSNAHAECRKEELRNVNKAEFSKKMKDGLMAKYGVEHSSHLAQTVERRKEAWIKKYGVDNPSKSDEIKQKKSNTCMRNHGAEHPLQCSDILEKQTNTMIEKYGVRRPAQMASVVEKMKKTSMERWGFENAMQNRTVASRVSKTWKSIIEQYPEEYPIVTILRDVEHQIWEDLKTVSLIKIAEKYGINPKSLRSALITDEFRDRYYKTYCFPKTQKQNEICDFIKSILPNSVVVPNCKFAIAPKELDIYVPEFKFAVELNGSFWHSTAFLDEHVAKTKHYIKTQMCREKDIFLLQIFEHDWDEKKEQICNYIKTKLNLNTKKISARKCIITTETNLDFFEQNHIQGNARGAIKQFNLVYDGEIVAAISASKHHHRRIDDSVIILNRLCFKNGYNIQGGASRLFSAFKKWAVEQGYEKIISWSDNSYSYGDIYPKLGFELEVELEPNFFYWSSTEKRYIKKLNLKEFMIQRPKGITRAEWGIMNSLFRIYDCGKKRWVMNLKAQTEVDFGKLKRIFQEISCVDTAYNADIYEQKKHISPLCGHCGCVAYTMQQLYGGDIMSGKVNGESHLWNKLPNGIEVDLTSCQYGGDGLHPLIKGKLYGKTLSANRFKVFKSRFDEKQLLCNIIQKRNM
jgi:hypothetical protein